MGKVPDSKESEAACLCGNCPSKTDDGLGLYCVRGKSPNAVTRGFCACSWCPLWSGYALTKVFFCDEGADEDGGAADGEAAPSDEAAPGEGSLAGDEEVT